MGRLWIVLGGLAGLVTVGMAAVEAHILASAQPDLLRLVESGVQIGGWHALALLACGIWAQQTVSGRRLAHAAGAAFTFGTLLFCGGVYARALSGIMTGPMVPIGGTLLMLGWLLLALSALRR